MCVVSQCTHSCMSLAESEELETDDGLFMQYSVSSAWLSSTTVLFSSLSNSCVVIWGH